MYARAPDDDTWYRWVIRNGEPQADRSGLYKYFERYFEPPAEDRPWSREISGRLESLGPNYREDAAARAAGLNEAQNRSSWGYRGRWFGNVALIRAQQFDVFHEPTLEPPDPAHANLVRERDDLFDETGKIVPFVVDDLVRCLQWEAT